MSNWRRFWRIVNADVSVLWLIPCWFAAAFVTILLLGALVEIPALEEQKEAGRLIFLTAPIGILVVGCGAYEMLSDICRWSAELWRFCGRAVRRG